MMVYLSFLVFCMISEWNLKILIELINYNMCLELCIQLNTDGFKVLLQHRKALRLSPDIFAEKQQCYPQTYTAARLCIVV